MPVLFMKTDLKYTLELKPTSSAVLSTDIPLSRSSSDRSMRSSLR